MTKPPSTLGVVIPVFNEQHNIAPVVARLRNVLDTLDVRWTVLFVDDGSTDGTVERLREANGADPRIFGLLLSRNFGKETALAAGLRACQGDAVIVMDGDLQHPPETIRAFYKAWRQGSEIVFGRRETTAHAGLRRRLASRAFYAVFRLLSRMPLDSGAVDFVLLDRKAVDALNRFGEHTRFTKGLFHWIGFKSSEVSFECAEREAGHSTFNLRRLLAFGLDGIVAFSSFPLRIWSAIGTVISASSIFYALYFAIKTMLVGHDVPGFPSLIVSITFLSGIQLLSLGVIGEYLSRIYDEAKGRPLFLVREQIGVDAALPPMTTKLAK
jgi:polyisoprenyl-phosphate glycosyltransferase